MTAGRCGAISPISTISWPAWWAAWTGRLTARRRLRVLNIGNHRSEQVSTLVGLLEEALGRRAIVREAPRPLSDVEETFASVEAIGALTGFAPRTSLAEGIPRFAAWFTAWNGHAH